MNDYSIAFGKVSRAGFSANPELKAFVVDLVNRAYFNLHGVSGTIADEKWMAAIAASAVQLCLDERVQQLSTRELIHLFENVIRVSEEHLREAKRHASMAHNVFYLKETVLDTIIEAPLMPLSASSTIATRSHGGRLSSATDEEVA